MPIVKFKAQIMKHTHCTDSSLQNFKYQRSEESLWWLNLILHKLDLTHARWVYTRWDLSHMRWVYVRWNSTHVRWDWAHMRWDWAHAKWDLIHANEIFIHTRCVYMKWNLRDVFIWDVMQDDFIQNNISPTQDVLTQDEI